MNYKLNLKDTSPLHFQIRRDLEEKITNGQLRPGDQIASNNVLAQKYKVSLITVKKAVASLIESGLLFSRIGKGTYVADKAQSRMSIKKQKNIGIVLRDIKHPFFSMILHSIEERAFELNYNILLSNSGGKIQKEESIIKRFQEMDVDGLIIASLSLQYRATPLIQKLHNENFPYIMISYMHDPEYWYIGSDHELGGYMATQYLLKIGYDKIGYVHLGSGNLLSEVRKNGYYRALMEHNIDYKNERIFHLDTENFDSGANRYQLGYKFGIKFSKLKKRPEALFFYTDVAALGFIQAVTGKGMKVPDDVAVIGYDDVEMSAYAATPLTTVRQPTDKIGMKAVEIIRDRIEGKEIGNRTIFKPTLVIRKSCGTN
ncbi:MAG: GntR family transcriptional regulator [Ignavibacteria bacterium]|nr:GntR family transcriptional regulator [Ignavibacteria bacterium]